MVDFDSNAKHAATVREVVKLLADSCPRFPFERVANLLLSAGLLDASEAAHLSKNAQLPDRLISELENALPRSVELGNLTSKSGEVQTLSEAGILSLTPPVAQSGKFPIEHFSSESVSTPKIFATRGGQATHFAHPSLSISWSNDGVIGPRIDRSARFFLNFMHDMEPRHLPGRTFMGFVKWSGNNYVHWLFDTFARLLALIEAGEDIKNFDQFVFLNTTNHFQKETLNELGIGPKRIIMAGREGQLFKTDEFVFVSEPRKNYAANAQVSDLIRSFIGQSSSGCHPKRKIFISRSKARRRRILNEDDVIDFLGAFGYERIWLEDLTIRETARIMAEAEAVISPHGAGFSNIVFASPGTRVLELIGARFTPEYWMIANELNLKYFAFEADASDGKNLDPEAAMKLSESERKNMGMRISMEKFKDFLENEFEQDK